MSDKWQSLREKIQNGLIDQAILMIRNEVDYREIAGFMMVMRTSKGLFTPELIETTLETFLNMKPNYAQIKEQKDGHGDWVHKLSWSNKFLWKCRMDGWIKKFYKAAFEGPNNPENSFYTGQLIVDFVNFAQFWDDPADFHITNENLRWVKYGQYKGYSKTYVEGRIKAGGFKSEEDFLRWKLHQTEALLTKYIYSINHLKNLWDDLN